jgi:hypothetical protein
MVYKIGYDDISHAGGNKFFWKWNIFSEFTFADLTTQPRILWLISHASSIAQLQSTDCRWNTEVGLHVQGTFTHHFLTQGMITISALPVVSTLKLLITATSNKCFSGLA